MAARNGEAAGPGLSCFSWQFFVCMNYEPPQALARLQATQAYAVLMYCVSLHWLIVSFVCSMVSLFTGWFVSWLVCFSLLGSIVCYFVPSFVGLFACTLVRWFILSSILQLAPWFVCSFSIVRLFVCSFVCWFVRSCIGWLVRLSIHSLYGSFICYFC